MRASRTTHSAVSSCSERWSNRFSREPRNHFVMGYVMGGSMGVALSLYVGRMCGFLPSFPPLLGELILLANGVLSIWFHTVARRTSASSVGQRGGWGVCGRGLYREILATLTLLLWFFVLSDSVQALAFVRLLLIGAVCETLGWWVPSVDCGMSGRDFSANGNDEDSRRVSSANTSRWSQESISDVKSAKSRNFSEIALAENRVEMDNVEIKAKGIGNHMPRSDDSNEVIGSSVATTLPISTPNVSSNATSVTACSTPNALSRSKGLAERDRLSEGDALSEDDAVNSSEQADGVDVCERERWTQRVVRSSETDGTERLECWLRIRLPALRKQIPIHLPIFPPLEREPRVEFEPESGPEVEIAVVQQFCQGIRLEIRRVGVIDQTEELVLHLEIIA